MPSRYAVKKGIAGVTLGLVGGELLVPVVYKIAKHLPGRARRAVHRYAPSHNKELATTILMGGLYTGNPATIGAGGGMLVGDIIHHIRGEKRAVKEWNLPIKGLPGIDFRKYDIPSWLPDLAIYKIVCQKIKQIVTEDTYNRAQRAWIPAGREHPAIVLKARQIVAENGLDTHDKIPVIQALQKWVQDNIAYSNDPRFLELLCHPYLMLLVPSGDCDCQAMLLASMGEAVGIHMKAKLITQDKNAPSKFTHVYSMAYIDGKDIPCETIFPMPLGWEPPGIVNEMVIDFG